MTLGAVINKLNHGLTYLSRTYIALKSLSDDIANLGTSDLSSLPHS